jgi:hypothetical protein
LKKSLPYEFIRYLRTERFKANVMGNVVAAFIIHYQALSFLTKRRLTKPPANFSNFNQRVQPKTRFAPPQFFFWLVVTMLVSCNLVFFFWLKK